MQDTFVQAIKADFHRWNMRRPVLGFLRLLFLRPGFQLCVSIRLQRVVVKVPGIGVYLAEVFGYLTTIGTGSEIPASVTIGSGIYFPHPHGIIIGAKVIIGRNVNILQNVTIGRTEKHGDQDPIIGDGVMISAGAVILGKITIGNNAVIGANAVVLSDVPDGCLAVGVPARIISRQAIANDLL